MATALNKPVTFDEFDKEISLRPKDKSPGITGITINMLKACPKGLLIELYDILTQLWTRRNDSSGRIIPESWLHRWLCLVPKDKKGPTKLDRIRPISLYEVTRKIWTGILNHRIIRIWEEQKALHPTQYGYRPNLGTESELMQLINVIEDVDEFNKTFFLIAFDTKKAFDSVRKPLMVAAWKRLGVPLDIAEYLVDLDKGGQTVVKSQHANAVYHDLGPKAILTNQTGEDSAASFYARDGIGQGDSTSALAWLAIYDILLCMLDDNLHPPYLYQATPDQMEKSDMFAYADDLNGVSPSLAHLQTMTDHVSAFNAITGFSFNDKLECGTNSHQDFGAIYAHDKHWKEITVPIKPKLVITILGVPVDLCNKWTDLKKYVATKISSLSIPIAKKNVFYLT